MEKAKRRIRAVLLAAVLTAVFVGMLYYFYNVRGVADPEKGTLIAGMRNGLTKVASYVIR